MSERHVSVVETVACLRRLAGAARWAERLLRRIGVEPAKDDAAKASNAELTKADSRQGVPHAE